MNCTTIDTILDEHRSATLSSAERQTVATHLDACARCTDSWAASDALLGEAPVEPPPELWARVQQLAANGWTQPRRHNRARAALAAVAAFAAVALLALRPWATTSEPPAATPSAAAVALPEFVAGRDYQLLARPAPATAVAAGRVVVTEFFMWPCFHCYTFEPELESWAARSADIVALRRVPVAFNPQAKLLARAFYTAEALGKSAEMHAAFYEEIHVRGNPLSSRGALEQFFARFGVDAAAFAAAFDSPAVAARVREGAELAREYQISATPTLVVAGRYSTDPSLARENMLAVVDQLVAEERRATRPAP